MTRSPRLRQALLAVAVTLVLAPAAGYAQRPVGKGDYDVNPDLLPTWCGYAIHQAVIDANQPYAITRPGTYCFTQDVRVSYTRAQSTTILILASDVTLAFRGHSLTELNGNGQHSTAIYVEGGHRSVRIDGGAIRGFTTGIYGYGWRTIPGPAGAERLLEQPIEALQVTDMTLEQMWETGVILWNARASVIARNTVTETGIGIAVAGNLTGTEVRENRITLGTGRFTTPGWFQFGIYGFPAYAVAIRENTIDGNARLDWEHLQQYGIVLFNGSPESRLKGYNVVERNTLQRLSAPIVLHGSGRAPNNVVRSNHVYGAGGPIEYEGPVTGTNVAIRVDNNEAITVNDNTIYSGPDVGYLYGIKLENGTTVTTQANGHPGVYDNLTCGVDIDLDPLSADGGNDWDACGLPA
jgi:hypothetical protein